jgi:D-lyxose ketol-isomerase
MITKAQWEKAANQSIASLKAAGIVLTPEEEAHIEVADFALNDLSNLGLQIVVYVNTARVCAKELIMTPWQTCPEHRHPTVNGQPGKEETFRCRAGIVYLYVSGEKNCEPKKQGMGAHAAYLQVAHEIILRPGEQYTLMPDTLHWFRAGPEGAIVSEFSTTSTDECDVFTDPRIQRIPEVEA